MLTVGEAFVGPREPQYFTCAACGKEFCSAFNAANHECKYRPEPPKED